MENNIETNPMKQDILAGKWKQMRGELKTWWGNSPMTMSTGLAVRKTSWSA